MSLGRLANKRQTTATHWRMAISRGPAGPRVPSPSTARRRADAAQRAAAVSVRPTARQTPRRAAPTGAERHLRLPSAAVLEWELRSFNPWTLTPLFGFTACVGSVGVGVHGGERRDMGWKEVGFVCPASAAGFAHIDLRVGWGEGGDISAFSSWGVAVAVSKVLIGLHATVNSVFL